MSFGWLGRDRNQPPCVEGITFDPYMPTRREEYSLVARTIKALGGAGDRMVWDAASGFTPHQHVLPYIVAQCGWTCMATDLNPATLDMPKHPRVYRLVQPMEDTNLIGPFEVVACISVLEHVEPHIREGFARQAARLCPKGGTLIVTADEVEPDILISLFPEFDFGARAAEPAEQMSPRVAFCVGKRH